MCVLNDASGCSNTIIEELVELGAIMHICAQNEDEVNAYLQDWKASGFRANGSFCDVSSQW